jgi:hypothetical protein
MRCRQRSYDVALEDRENWKAGKGYGDRRHSEKGQEGFHATSGDAISQPGTVMIKPKAAYAACRAMMCSGRFPAHFAVLPGAKIKAAI